MAYTASFLFVIQETILLRSFLIITSWHSFIAETSLPLGNEQHFLGSAGKCYGILRVSRRHQLERHAQKLCGFVNLFLISVQESNESPIFLNYMYYSYTRHLINQSKLSVNGNPKRLDRFCKYLTDCVNLGTHLVTSSFKPASFNSKTASYNKR